jgi:membrane-associated protease RseP (regulator of RpoE activity)
MFGLTLVDLRRQLAEYFGLPDGHGVLVEEVEKNSPAAKAGFKAGDVIVSIGKESIRRKDDIRWALEDYTEKDKVEVGIIRKGNRQTFTLAMEDNRTGAGWRSRPRDLWVQPEEFDIDVEVPTEGPEVHFDSEGIKSGVRHFESDMKTLGKEIKRHMHELNFHLRNELRTLSI